MSEEKFECMYKSLEICVEGWMKWYLRGCVNKQIFGEIDESRNVCLNGWMNGYMHYWSTQES